jgi:hypothetical protein
MPRKVIRRQVTDPVAFSRKRRGRIMSEPSRNPLNAATSGDTEPTRESAREETATGAQ